MFWTAATAAALLLTVILDTVNKITSLKKPAIFLTINLSLIIFKDNCN